MMRRFRWGLVFLLAAALGALFVAMTATASTNLLRLEAILTLLQADRDLWWRQKSGLDTRFENTAVTTDAGGFRTNGETVPAGRADYQVVCLGGSPTFGYGVEADETYAKAAERVFQQQGQSVHLFNAGQIGYSSHQGLILLQQHLPRWQPDLITVSYVVNDIDRLRFFFAGGQDDRHTPAPSAWRVSAGNLIRQCPVTAFLSRRWRRLLVRVMDEEVYRGSYEMTHVRVPAEDYARNLLRFVEICRRENIKLIFIKMPFSLPEPVPPPPADIVEQVATVEKMFAAGDYQQARLLAEKLVALDRFHSRTHYLQGKILYAQGEKEAARQAFRQAMENLIFDCVRDARRYNRIMEEVAQRSGVPLVDAASVLAPDTADMKLYVKNDYIHPNGEGHRLVGNCLAAAVSRVRAGADGWFVQACR